jgi:hypothetical protein
VAFTDTGTDPLYAWVKANVEFASGHGCFHGAAAPAGVIFDLISSTRFISFAGTLIADGTGTEAAANLLNRAYNNFAALQVRVTANARTNNSVFRNRINGADGTGIITFGAGVTGLLQDTSIGDALADGDLICASLTLLTGAEDLTVSLVGCTLTSGGTKSEVFAGNYNGSARTASATANYITFGGNVATIGAGYTDAQARVPVGFDGIASNLRCLLSANTYTGAGTLKLMKNGSAVITTTIGAAGGAAWYENSSDTVSFVASDEFSFEFDEGTANSITINAVVVTLEASVAVGQPTWKRWGGVENMGGLRTSQGARVW